MKIFSVYSRIEPWHKIPIRVFILGLLGHAAFYEDKTYCGVCLYADQRGNLSFIVRVKVNWVLCKACGICRILLKSTTSDGRNLPLFTLSYTWVSDLQCNTVNDKSFEGEKFRRLLGSSGMRGKVLWFFPSSCTFIHSWFFNSTKQLRAFQRKLRISQVNSP